MAILFISDLHLSENTPELTAIFLKFLKKQSHQAESLYILGDLFESWLGDDLSSPFTQQVSEAFLNATTNGLKIYFMPGNRDFLVGNHFLTTSNIQYLRDPSCVDIYGIRTVLMHGDTLCTNDTAYQCYRYWVHQTFIQQVFLKLPMWMREKIASYLKRPHLENKDYFPKEKKRYAVVESEVQQILAQNQATFLIHGHTHRPGMHRFFAQEIWYSHIVLSDWHEYGNCLIWEPSGSQRLIYFN